MKWWAVLAVLSATLGGCATIPSRNISGTVDEGAGPVGAQGPRIGIVADSQLQTRRNYSNVRGYRGRIEDSIVWVSIRPPALDWAARSLLRTHLEQLVAGNAQAIFYLGDGANNGCFDEFAAGYRAPWYADRPAPEPNEEGILAILDEFRRNHRIPVYFVLGNHDILGAGSTGNRERRIAFCANERDNFPNEQLTKFEVMRLVDHFNRANAGVSSEWSYESSLTNPSETDRLCSENGDRQHRAWGCYLAARVDYRRPEAQIQFLLLDTNDWVEVTESRMGSFDQEGLRGAMSFGRDRDGTMSQTSWFMRHASDPVAMRVALSHYDVVGLRKKVPLFGRISSQSQLFMNLFSTPGLPRRINQAGAYAITAHTHNRGHIVGPHSFRIRCDPTPTGCAPDQALAVTELNVGSTTDYSNYSTLVQLVPERDAPGSLYYQRLDIDANHCEDIYRELDRTGGWASFGISRQKRHNYRRFSFEDVRRIWANLDAYAGSNRARTNCIGLFAAALERGEIDPNTGLPIRRERPPPRQP